MTAEAIWLPATLLAGLLQAWRTAVQQKLRTELTVGGAGLARYLYGAPVAILLLSVYVAATGMDLPAVGVNFMIAAAAAGLAQVIGTNLLIMAFGFRNFVVGTAFAKTEAVQAALFAWLLLGEGLTLWIVAGIIGGVSGVLLLALGGQRMTWRELLTSIGQPAALCGLGAGAMFALTSVFVKRATVELGMADIVGSALVALAVVMVLQTLMQGGFVLLREPATLGRVFATWRTSGQVGLLASIGSACWFTGFATAPLAQVRVVGQVEVIFTLLFAHHYLGEHTKRHEAAGLMLVAAGVVLAIIGGIRS